jgi:LAS superfamily LD-carboxypeptidase LdcB
MLVILRCRNTIGCRLSEKDSMQVIPAMISGKTEEHLCQLNTNYLLHKDVLSPFRALQEAAAMQGYDLQVASAFRSFERQLIIWNAKARGELPVLDESGHPLSIENLGEKEKVFAIMRWSALPGCSRHHWGTDMDIWDAAAVSQDYVLQLTPDEYQQDGPFHGLSCWLDEHAEAFGFVRPYAIDSGGVAPEPWHLSYTPVARAFDAKLDAQFICKVLDNSDLILRDTVLDYLDEIISRFICLDN